ncbi:hypothetical protein SAMN06296386_10452 [Lachnospiraceae bacterium]|nr:hypothetical protein SAMN06296386_10452 [Lachnospiraceae bacterium]
MFKFLFNPSCFTFQKDGRTKCFVVPPAAMFLRLAVDVFFVIMVMRGYKAFFENDMLENKMQGLFIGTLAMLPTSLMLLLVGKFRKRVKNRPLELIRLKARRRMFAELKMPKAEAVTTSEINELLTSPKIDLAYYVSSLAGAALTLVMAALLVYDYYANHFTGRVLNAYIFGTLMGVLLNMFVFSGVKNAVNNYYLFSEMREVITLKINHQFNK